MVLVLDTCEHVVADAADVETRMGKAQILINNAGVALRKDLVDTTLDEWQAVQSGNLTSAFLMSRAFVPQMKAMGSGQCIDGILCAAMRFR